MVSFHQDYENYRDITIQLHDNAIMRNDYLKDAKALNEDITRLRFGLEDLSSNLMTTENYLDKYLPFRIQNFISEALEEVLPQQQLSKLIEFEKIKYKHMHDAIIQDEGVPNDNMQQVSALIKNAEEKIGDDGKSIYY